MSRAPSPPLRCPSCGGILPAVGTACSTCGFTVWRADGGWDDQVFRGTGDAVAAADPVADAVADRAARGAAADGASAGAGGGGTSDGAAAGGVDTVVDEAPDGASAGWAASPPSPPPSPHSLSSITPPAPVDLPPSQVSVDGLDIDWSNRFSLRAGWGTTAPVSGGRHDQAAATRSVGAPSRAAAGMAALIPSASGRVPGATRPGSGSRPTLADDEQVVRAAARALRRRGELSAAAGAAAPAAAAPKTLPVAGFDQVLSSDFRGAATISGGAASFVPTSSTTTTRWAPSGASAVDFPGWFRGISNPGAAARGRSAGRRAPLPRAGVWLGVVALLFVGLLVFTVYAQRWSGGPGTASGGASSVGITMPVPRSADLAIARRELAGLATIAGAPSAQIAHSRPAAARHARSLRTRLILWRDRFELTAHQTVVLDNAIAYAGALGRWLQKPAGAARHAAALKAWRVWRADDPGLGAG